MVCLLLFFCLSGKTSCFPCVYDITIISYQLCITLLQIADAIGVEDSVVEDQIVSDDRFELFDKFFELNGSKKLMFYYQVCRVMTSR